jgi:hypothetical protein
MTIRPPATLAMDGASLKQTHTHATASGVACGKDRPVQRCPAPPPTIDADERHDG